MTKSIYTRWKKGMEEITPEQQIHAKMVGHFWGTIGLILAMAVMLYRGIWYFGLFLAAMIWMQWWQFKGTRQQYEKVKEIQDDLDSNEVLKRL